MGLGPGAEGKQCSRSTCYCCPLMPADAHGEWPERCMGRVARGGPNTAFQLRPIHGYITMGYQIGIRIPSAAQPCPVLTGPPLLRLVLTSPFG